ncbi:hypothetical protein HPB50_003124 [Hyalomma asiaticum]|uniref:Uncharacterized protein n=1 Tax=Hyalomma asiaticum TaxID=266040 RepID=A0ACB7S368_HYAAI|nr:hypothetical protein HPB50_003124 [Hyalomma asiaticum]
MAQVSGRQLRSGKTVPAGGEQDSELRTEVQLMGQQLYTFQRVAEMSDEVLNSVDRMAAEPHTYGWTYMGYDETESVAYFLGELDNMRQSYWRIGSVHDGSSRATGITGCRRTIVEAAIAFHRIDKDCNAVSRGIRAPWVRGASLALLEYVRMMQEVHRLAAPTVLERDKAARDKVAFCTGGSRCTRRPIR